MGSEIAPDRVARAGGSFSGAVQRMFDGLAPRYDAFNRWASLGMDAGWRRAAIRALAPAAGDRVVDIATGTGDLALQAAASGARVVGVDFAPEMVARARDKAARGAAGFQVARAEALPFADRTFDGAVSGFALRNVRPILDEVLAEALRVLRPGGRLVVLEFSEPGSALVRWGHGIYTRALVPRIGRWLTGDGEPFDYLNRSIDAWLTPGELEQRIRDSGFDAVGHRLLSLGTVALHWGRRPSTEASEPRNEPAPAAVI